MATKKDKKKRCKWLNVVLDIDETLLCYVDNESLEALKFSSATKNKPFGYEYRAGKKGSFVLRPHVKTFLKWLFEHCNVCLWTWSDIDYARDVADYLTDGHPEKFTLIYADEEAEASGDEHGNSKDLNYLWYTKGISCFSECNTILIDDLPSNSINSSNKYNSITIEPFNPTKKNMTKDKSLRTILTILRKISKQSKNCLTREPYNVLSPANIKQLGLEMYVRTITTKKNNTLQAIGVGDSLHFVDEKKKRKSFGF